MLLLHPLPVCSPPQLLITDIPGMKHGTIVWYLRLVREAEGMTHVHMLTNKA